MVNIQDINPDQIQAAPEQAAAPASAPANIADIDPGSIQTEAEHVRETYGTPAQTVLGGAEQVAQGVIGPFASALEEATGLTTGEAIRGRQQALGVAAPILQGAGLVGSALIPGLGEASLAGAAGRAGEAAVAATLPEATGLVAKIAQTGIKTGAEMAALQTSDELSKMITGDPNQSVQTAAINIGLSGIIGGVGGAALGTVSPLWNKALNKIGVEKLASDFMGETQAIRNAGADPLQSATSELQGRMDEADQMWRTMTETKPEILAKAMPEATPENAAKINSQIQDISDQMESVVKKASESVKTRSAVPYLSEDLANFQNAVTDPNAKFEDKFYAMNELKQALDGYARWGSKFGATEEQSAKGMLGKSISNLIRPALEDSSVWGAAGNVQKVTNNAISGLIKATDDFRPAVISNVQGVPLAAPEKVQTLLNQASAGKVGRKATVVGNYLDATQKYADIINKVHLDNGLEAPIASKLNPTPNLDHVLNTAPTPGVMLARWVNKRGSSALGHALGEAGAGAVGGGIGALVGHPLVGAWMGEKVLTPIFSALAKPIAETAINSEAAKATVDYAGNVLKGQKALASAAANFFRYGAEVVAKDMTPDAASREKLERSLEYARTADNSMNVGGQIGHYLPNHATAASSTASTAAQYFDSLKPKQPEGLPFDTQIPVGSADTARYERQLDIAQQPLLAIQHAKNGTLLPQDVMTLNTIYPQLRNQMASKIGEEMIKAKSEGKTVPYYSRVGLSQLFGYPLDSTMTPQAAHAVMASSAGAQSQVQQSAQRQQRKPATNKAISQINKVNQLYATPTQARQMDKRDNS